MGCNFILFFPMNIYTREDMILNSCEIDMTVKLVLVHIKLNGSHYYTFRVPVSQN